MIKSNKLKLIITSIVILLPIVFGLIFWNELPNHITTHWGIDGEPDGWSSRYFAVFALPIFSLTIHWLCIFCTTVIDKKNKNQNKKVFNMIIWITPIISLFSNGIIYLTAFEKDFSPYLITFLLMGAVFIIIGNYLPKTSQNYTIGIKVSWTLNNEENWNATHRFSGKVWVIGGVIILTFTFLPEAIYPWLIFYSVVALVTIPIIYSYLYYKRQVREGDIKLPQKNNLNKFTIIVYFGVGGIILGLLGFIMFSGDINVKYFDESFTVEASYWNDITINYDDIKSVEYRDDVIIGMRTNGFGSAALLLGAFRNEEFGNYMRYSYTNCNECVVLNVDDKILVINGIDKESTKEIYEKMKFYVDFCIKTL